MASIFTDARDVSVSELKVINVSPPIGDPLNDLASRIAAGALHDSDERCDAPKCHPETRIAVQDEIYGWIIHGDPLADSAQKTVEIKWVTGAAGTGKSAVMGSVADTCKQNGVPAVTFFFASYASPDRRRKTAFIPTLAYQLAEHLPALKDPVTQAIRDKPLLFKKNLRVQMEALILTPLRQVAVESNVSGVVLVDGLDECEAEQFFDSNVASRAGKSMEREKGEDQLEILQVLRDAALDPAFPFRIVIASRPERVFREFFNNENYKSSFAPSLILDDKYNPNADILLFFQAKFSEIRRRYNLDPSWPSPEILASLLDQASGQFIYAATIIRYITTSRHESPQALLDQVLKVKPTSAGTNPFSHLDAFYTHILQSTSNRILAVKWLWVLKGEIPGWPLIFYFMRSPPAAFLINLFLQTDNSSAGLNMPYIPQSTSRLNFAPSSVDWWASGCVSHSEDVIRWMFYYVHWQCHWYRCSPTCKLWRNSILRHCKKADREVPSRRWLLRNRFDKDFFPRMLRCKAARMCMMSSQEPIYYRDNMVSFVVPYRESNKKSSKVKLLFCNRSPIPPLAQDGRL
ncbi:hypothetical protein EST38_g12159 [Candolleomyces aberdarensis]|uniref:Nephrocystin 3-like N-terminal domain-containing protein n=1 Tax=Candolleomyces aberdarensis TaxID=2316362 RepID=A0A4Q2D589_9AGAR|nr:hypothetical protein EST38_g12159 [Candolleomyces aberdarensis]